MRVLLAFDDESLGGTSRSALVFAEAWHIAGAQVLVYCPRRPHPARAAQLAKAEITVTQFLADVVEFKPHLIHLHHGAPSVSTIRWVGLLLTDMARLRPAVLTHDIFGQGLGTVVPKILAQWERQQHVVGLLGDWLAAQHSAQYGNRGVVRRIVPNPQDFTFFRPPTQVERNDVRAARGIGPQEKVLLRVGSPIIEKWTIQGYLRLAESVIASETHRLRLVGPPPELISAMPIHERIEVIPVVTDDDRLREEYWAADLFMHWADRGESFGNVLLEALGTGLSVAYRSRAFRDNTPWEFQRLQNFHYFKDSRAWLGYAFAVNRTSRIHQSLSADLDVYGTDRLRAILTDVVAEVNLSLVRSHALDIGEILQHAFRPPRELPFLGKCMVTLRHNPAAAALKSLKRRIKQ